MRQRKRRKLSGWRERIPRAPLEVGAGPDRWQEFGGATPGDARPSASPVTCARHQGADERQLDTSARLAPPIPASPLPYPWLALIRLAGVTTRTLRHQDFRARKWARIPAVLRSDGRRSLWRRRIPPPASPVPRRPPVCRRWNRTRRLRNASASPASPRISSPALAPRWRRGRRRRPRPGTRRRGAPAFQKRTAMPSPPLKARLPPPPTA